jgi:hypothetical protein
LLFVYEKWLSRAFVRLDGIELNCVSLPDLVLKLYAGDRADYADVVLHLARNHACRLLIAEATQKL